jgi:hypothetical protein
MGHDGIPAAAAVALLCARRRDGVRVARRPDHAIALTVLALEVGRLGISLADTVVPHGTAALGAVRYWRRFFGVGVCCSVIDDGVDGG